MAWLSSVSWTTGDTPVLATVLNNIAADIRTLGGNVDGAGNSLLNLGGLRVRAVSGTGNAPGAAFFGQAADGSGVIIARDSATANPYELWLGVNQATGYAEIQGAQGGVGFRSLILNRQGGNVGIGITAPGASLHIDRIANDSAAILRIGNLGSYFSFARNATTGALSVQGNQTGFENICLAPTAGKVGIGTADPKSKLHVTGLETHASNAAAISAGKTAGAFYTDGAGAVKVVY